MLSVQKISSSGLEEVYLADFTSAFPDILSVLENSEYRIVIYEAAITGVWLGDFALQQHEFSAGEQSVSIFTGEFTASALKHEESKPLNSRYFSKLFENSVGFSELTVECDGVSYRVPIEILSTKVAEEELYRWVQTIADVFPIYLSEFHFSPVVSGKTSADENFGAKSLSTLIKELGGIISEVKASIYRSGYLASNPKKVYPDGAFSDEFYIKSLENVFKHNQDWRRTSLRSDTLVRKGIFCFEPTKFSHPELGKNFDHPINSNLFDRLRHVGALLNGFYKQLNTSNVSPKIRGSQFSTKESKVDLQEAYRSMIGKILKNVEGIISELEQLGVKSRERLNHRTDFRHELLNSHVHRIHQIINFFRKLDIAGDLNLGLPSTDEVFEQFCFAEIVNVFVNKLSFTIVDSGVSFPVNYYIHLYNDVTGEDVRIFYEYPIFKDNNSTPALPFADMFKFGGEKRPDFTIHIQHEDFESIAILDAKYMRRDNAERKFKVFNGENLISKYGTKFVQTSGFGFPAIFVGAIYPSEQNDLELTKFESLLSPKASVDSNTPALQQLGIASLSSASDKGLTDMLRAILAHSRNLRSKLPSFTVSELIKPEQYIFDGFKLLPGRDAKKNTSQKDETQSSSRNTRHSAPTISEADAKIVKGMLRRGDKQQDIALFFGVNQGRITEIKKGEIFQNVEGLPFDQLPPQGPYPLIRDFLGFKSVE